MNKYLNNNQIGNNCKIYKDVILNKSVLHNAVSIGDFSMVRNSSLSDKVEIGRRNTIDHAIIGRGTYTGEFCVAKYCSIGKFCAISWNVSIGGANHDIYNIAVTPLSRIFTDDRTYRSFFEEDVVIGNDVWIAAGAHILRGVTIGNGAVIAANAVVTHDVAPYSIVAGVPAKKIGQRFDNNIIRRLQLLKWWDWPEQKIVQAKALFEKPLNESVLSELETIE